MAVHPQHLSWWERFRGVHKSYDQEKDMKDKIDEIRREWETKEAEKRDHEVKGTAPAQSGIDDDYFTDHVHDYFRETSNTGSNEKAAARGGEQTPSIQEMKPELKPEENKEKEVDTSMSGGGESSSSSGKG